MENVTPIGSRRKPENSRGPKKGEVYRQLCPIISEGLKEKFFLIQPEVGKRLIIEEYEPGIVRYVPRQHVVNCLLSHLERYLDHEKKFALTNEEGHFAVKYWVATGEVIPTPQIVGELDETEFVFHRLPFNVCPGPTPTFDEFFARCTNAISIQAWIGSLFFEESDRQQYVWIFGDGGDGKGALTHTLEKVFGPSSCSPGIPEKGSSRFWTYQLLGKRLITIPECQNYTFMNGTLFKQLTGGDSVCFEQKGQDPFTARPSCKFLFSSNERPKIDSARANERRIIYGEVQSPTENVEDLLSSSVIEGAMWKEVPHFIFKCKELFKNYAPDMGIIPTDKSVFKALAELNEEHDEVIFHKYFAVGKKTDYVLSSTVLEKLKNEHLNDQQKRNFYKFMRNKYKCKPGRESSKKRRHCWFGMILESDSKEVIDIIDNNTSFSE